METYQLILTIFAALTLIIALIKLSWNSYKHSEPSNLIEEANRTVEMFNQKLKEIREHDRMSSSAIASVTNDFSNMLSSVRAETSDSISRVHDRINEFSAVANGLLQRVNDTHIKMVEAFARKADVDEIRGEIESLKIQDAKNEKLESTLESINKHLKTVDTEVFHIKKNLDTHLNNHR